LFTGKIVVNMARHKEALRMLLCDILKISAGCVVRGQKEKFKLLW